MIGNNITFVFEGRTYEIEQFNVRFSQGVDHKGQPQHEMSGGQLYIVLTQSVEEFEILCENGHLYTVLGKGVGLVSWVFELVYFVKIKELLKLLYYRQISALKHLFVGLRDLM